MIKLFASDLDGTLLNGFHKMDKTILNTINKAIQDNYYFVLASGRNFHPRAYRSFHLENTKIYTVGCNGSIIKDENHQLIYSKDVDKDMLKKLHELLPEQPLRIHQLDHVGIFYDNPHFSLLRTLEYWLLKLIFQPKGTFTSQDYLTLPIQKVDIIIPNKSQRKKLDQFLLDYKDRVVDAKAFLNTYEITDVSANKATGIEKLMERLNVKEDEVQVYGDEHNDIEMFKHFSNNAAPDNCGELLRPYVKRFVGSNWHHGVCRDIENIIENQKIKSK